MITPIENDGQYEDALERIYNLMQKDIQPDSKESEELQALVTVIKEFEDKYYPIK